MTEWLAAPGDAWVCLADGFTLLLDAQASGEIMRRAAMSRTPVEVLDVLLRDGVAAAPDFCLVSHDELRCTAYLRGNVAVRMEAHWGEACHETGRGVKSLREVSVDGVTRVAIFGAAAVAEVETPIRLLVERATPVGAGIHTASLVTWERVTIDPEMLITTPAIEHNETIEVPELYDELFGATMHMSIEQAAVRPAEPDEIDEPRHDLAAHVSDTHDTATVISWVIELPDGRAPVIEYAAVIGRRPAPHPLAHAESTQLFALADPDGNLSRSHALMYVAEGGLYAMDLGSTNGTVVIRDDAVSPIAPNTAVEVQAGDTVMLGGEVRVGVRRGV